MSQANTCLGCKHHHLPQTLHMLSIVSGPWMEIPRMGTRPWFVASSWIGTEETLTEQVQLALHGSLLQLAFKPSLKRVTWRHQQFVHPKIGK